jgi:hypothetical protein
MPLQPNPPVNMGNFLGIKVHFLMAECTLLLLYQIVKSLSTPAQLLNTTHKNQWLGLQ